MIGPVAFTVPLNSTHVLPLLVCGGFKSMDVFQEVEAVGLTFTVHVAEAELPRIQPETVCVAPTAQPLTSCRTPPPPEELVFAIC